MLLVSRILLAVVFGRAEFFCCCAPLGASFLAGPEQKKHYPQYFDCCCGLCWVTPLFGAVAARVSCTGLELFFARFGRPGVFCLSRTVGLRYFPAGPEEKQQNDNIAFESPWCFCLNALNFLLPSGFHNLSAGLEQRKKNETPV